ncbi:MFS transporter [Sedimentibacter hydroxybenzoicus DSM 7310]|uniref:MFS transporter n=1 Tax=Sedimentibacter hydroxybenzoicus DSM 7310 TaxID=1123245 RepID=A0A974BJA6_SEDHY|nr:MFS transporter [Sedimentibacter hydroxybenzoicus]NYB74113.1 MFS transporter [Sedimentibacter hydroxybenzoicus DSM 7310]
MIESEKTLKKLSLPLFLISLPLTVMSILLPMYTTALGLTPLQVTGLFSVFSLGLVVMRLFIGYVSDKVGRKPVFILGLIIYTLSYFIYSNAKIISLIYIGRGLQAIAAAFISISSYSMIADLNMKKNAHNFGKVDSYSEKGGLLGVLLCFYVLNTPELIDGWSKLFLICAVASIIAVVYSIFFLNETKSIGNNDFSNISLPSSKNNIILFNLIIRIFTSSIFSIFVLYLQKRFNSNLLEIGVAFLLPTVMIAFAYPMIGKISDSIGSRKTLVCSLSVLVIILLILPYMNNIYLYGIAWTVYYITVSLFDVTINSLFVENITGEIRGSAVGKFTMGSNIGSFIGPLIGGFAFQEIGIQVPFFISSIGFAILLMLYIKRVSVN